MSEEEKEVIEKLINNCDNCPYNQCEQCEINWTQVQAIKKLKEEIKQKQEIIDKIIKELEEFYEKYDVVSKDKIREKLKKLRKEEDRISKLNYELEPEKAIDSLLLRIGDLEELLKGE